MNCPRCNNPLRTCKCRWTALLALALLLGGCGQCADLCERAGYTSGRNDAAGTCRCESHLTIDELLAKVPAKPGGAR